MINMDTVIRAAATFSPKHRTIFDKALRDTESNDVHVLANIFAFVCGEHRINPNMPNPFPRYSDEWHGWNACFPEIAEVHDEREAKAALDRLEEARHADPEPEDEAEPLQGPEMPELAGLSDEPLIHNIGGVDYEINQFIRAAHALSGLTVEQWNALPDVERERMVQEAIDDTAAKYAPAVAEPAPEPPAEAVHGTETADAPSGVGQEPATEPAPAATPEGEAPQG